MNDILAPIVFFAYNRPAHTTYSLQSLFKNHLASESTLFIYCDGPKPGATVESLKNIKEVRRIVKEKQWCKEVKIIEADSNIGLAESIRTGVSEVIQINGKVIVLEDDIICSPAFLNFMNIALNHYEKRKTVFSITGYNLPHSKMQIPSDYNYDVWVCLRNGSWGWATWEDRWEHIDWDLSAFDTLQLNKYMQEAFNRGGEDVFPMLQAQKSNFLNIWSIQFTLAHFVNHAVSIVPTISYVDNIGLDGSGDNCSTNQSFRNKNLNNNIHPRLIDVLYEDKRLINSFYSASYPKKRPLWKKISNKISRMMGGNNLFRIKKKVYC